MRAGRLSDWLVFEKKSIDASNVISWTADLSMWGEFQPLAPSSIQTSLDGTELSRIDARFITRYRDDIHASTHRIWFENKVWNILEPIRDRKHTQLTIEAHWTDPEGK